MIRLNNFWLFLRSDKSFLKKDIIANKEPKCKLISISNEFDFKSNKLETKNKCADELIGKNSDIPWIAERIKISKIFWNIESS